MTDVIILSGPPGSGKTTIARPLAKQYPLAVHLHTDDFWRAIASGAIAPYLSEADPQNQTVVAVAAGAAFGFAAGGYTTIVDGVVGPWMLHHYRKYNRRCPAVTLHYIVLRPDRQTALVRAQQRTAPGALTDEGPILELWDQFTDLNAYGRHAIDTSYLDVDASVETVRTAIKRRTHTVDADDI